MMLQSPGRISDVVVGLFSQHSGVRQDLEVDAGVIGDHIS